jgi:iron complex transport system ATP-binding protein
MDLLNIQQLDIGRRSALVSNINCNIGQGQLVVLTGVNGCGKSTMLKTIAGLIKPLSGNVAVNGHDISRLDVRDRAKLVAFASTGRLQEDYITVREMISFGRFPFGRNLWNQQAPDPLVEASIQLLNIGHIADAYLNKISDGEWQKANVCRALAQHTPLILMDEPTAFLDYPSKIQLFKDLRSIATQHQRVIILSTHDIDIASQYGTLYWHVSHGGMQSSEKPLPWT